ncbi:MAG: homoserine O-acetyltransferase [Methanobacteriales archaeon HGW-Methanobacteriales-1]|jgi:homoserine O-acetyltransferase|nr:MAG: homoserine O-acetyltransferase [Methanobacteriales archaeon HGW-Methanobacteriales-1]
MKKESVGLVETQHFHLPGELHLESGKKLQDITIAYETYGKLNKEKNNAILICHALSGDAHVAGWHEGDAKPGWWDIIIGPNRCLDTKKYFIISSNVLGGCKGSTGPASINPKTGKPYGLDFPIITIKDMVKAQKKLVEHFDIQQLLAVIGGSMGGMQVLEWCNSYPKMVRKAIPIATAAHSSPQQIAFNEVGRRAIISDPQWKNGSYYDEEIPKDGLGLARMIAHITYLSYESMYEKFGRRLQDKEKYSFDFDLDFEVESYLHYQGESFVKRFDANSYLYITKAIDYFDLTSNGSLIEGLKNIKSKMLVISVDSDWLYPPSQSKEILEALSANEVDVSYAEIKSPYGHDAFLLESGQLNYIIGNFLSDNLVQDVMDYAVPSIEENATLEEAAKLMMDCRVTHIPVVSSENTLIGIVTAWDISKAVALKIESLDQIMTRKVVVSRLDETIEQAAEKMKNHNISSLPVIDNEQKIKGLITTDHISTLITKY